MTRMWDIEQAAHAVALGRNPASLGIRILSVTGKMPLLLNQDADLRYHALIRATVRPAHTNARGKIPEFRSHTS